MTDNYLNTAKAMFEAGKVLRAEKSYRNSCYLLGYVAECFYKVILAQISSQQRKIHNLNALDSSVDAVRIAQTHRVSSYLSPPANRLMTSSDPVNGYSDPGYRNHWDPFHRYDGSRWDEQACDSYQLEAEEFHRIMIQMELDGVIS